VLTDSGTNTNIIIIMVEKNPASPKRTSKKSVPSPRSLLFPILLLAGILILLLSQTVGVLSIVESLASLKPAATNPYPYENRKWIYDFTHQPWSGADTKDRRQIGRENATLVMLVRNRELKEAVLAMRSIEDRFNKKYKYPWVFMNDREFTEDFKEYTTGMASGHTEYYKVPKEAWQMTPGIDRDLVFESVENFTKEGVIYGDSLSYRRMCRFNSGYFFRMAPLLKYKYYWRVEPDVELYCDQQYDPFTFMRENNKLYGFVMAMYEYPQTVATLAEHVQGFFDVHPQYVHPNSSVGFLKDKRVNRFGDLMPEWHGEWNLCHFWSNFEIGNMDFFRSKKYLEFFEWLDRAGGFFYERWGDAPVHSLAVGYMMDKTQVHQFADIGYYHPPFFRCPADEQSHKSGRCACPEDLNGYKNFDYEPMSCLPRWWGNAGKAWMKDGVHINV
jgi:mannosyltransferase